MITVLEFEVMDAFRCTAARGWWFKVSDVLHK